MRLIQRITLGVVILGKNSLTHFIFTLIKLTKMEIFILGIFIENLYQRMMLVVC